jgi:hypothetical protein
MKIDFNAVIKDGNGDPVADASVKIALEKAILAGESDILNFDLFLKLRQADENTDFSLDEVQLLVKAVKVYPTLIMGQLTYLLNQKPYNIGII